MYGAGGQKRIPDTFIKDFRALIPPLHEQSKIANFLDRETARIDALIEKKRRLLELREEKRLAVITHAVTKGLDQSAPMKDSGIDWLGQIPAHWEVKRLKHLADKIVDGAHLTPTYVDEGVPFLRVTDIVTADGGNLRMDDLKRIPQEEHEELTRRCKPQRGDVLYSKNGTIGVPRVVDWDFEFSIFVSLCLIKVRRLAIEPQFLALTLLGTLTTHQLTNGSKSNTVTNLHLDKIKEFVVLVPPRKEQLEITECVEARVDHISATSRKIDEAISRLAEYRSALITNAVTGKIDVREAAQREAAQ